MRLLFLTFLLLALQSSAGAATVTFGDGDSSAVTERVAHVLSQYRSDRDASNASKRLRALRPEPMSSVIQLLSSRAIRSERTELAPTSDPEERTLLVEVARRWPEQRFVELLVRNAQPDAPLSSRVHTLRILGEVAGANSLKHWVEVALGTPDTQRRHARIARTIEDSLTSILLRDPFSYPALARAANGLDRSLLPTLVRSLGAAGRGQGLALLERFLGRSNALDLEVLAAIGELRPWAKECLDGRAAAIIKPFLTSIDPKLRRQAALSLGRLHAADAFADLLGMLGDPDARVQKSAHWTLKAISGLQWPDDFSRWEAWHERELEWFESEAEALLEDADTAAAARAVAALRSVSLHPLFGRSSAVRIARALDHPQEAVAVAACNALAQLGHAAGIEPLVRALGDGRTRVRESASIALGILTMAELRHPEAAGGSRQTQAAWQEWARGEIE